MKNKTNLYAVAVTFKVPGERRLKALIIQTRSKEEAIGAAYAHVQSKFMNAENIEIDTELITPKLMKEFQNATT